MGSKNRIAKDILPLMLKDRKKGQYWVEPFVGGANMIDKVTGKRLGSDVNKYLIACLESIASGWIPDDKWSESLYNDIKNNKDEYIASMTGYAGFALSYGGKWFGGWCRDSAGKRNYVLEAHKNDNIYKYSSYTSRLLILCRTIYCYGQCSKTINC